ncbi:MAG TPA: hypothetical protein VFP59_16220 [Candidatus Angelobacter sp.]|nr:hypothetical protein [Candidatus Angelobacter sp.]
MHRLLLTLLLSTGAAVLVQSNRSEDIGAKLNAELAACAGRCTVHVPAGNYLYTTDIVMMRPATLECDGDVVLDYKGTGNAVKLGRDGMTPSNYGPDPYVVKGCTFTGGERMKAGIFVNEFVVESVISDNYFHNFGNVDAFNIWYQGRNWDARVVNNYMWADSNRTLTYNGIAQNAADPANKVSGDFGQSQLFLLNNHLQNIARHQEGVGVYVNGVNGQLIDNVIAGFAPNIQLGAFSNGSQIKNVTMERSTPGPAPCIAFGDSSGARVGYFVDGVTISDSTCNVHNTDFGTAAHFLGPSTGKSGMQGFRLINNAIPSSAENEPIVQMNDLPSQYGNYATLNRIGVRIPLGTAVSRLHANGTRISKWAGSDEELSK